LEVGKYTPYGWGKASTEWRTFDMQENYKFEELKFELLKEVQNYKVPSDLTLEFREKFMRLIEMCTFSLMNEKENFFALFMIQMKRAIKLDMPSATGISASMSYFTIYFNPAIFLKCSLSEMKALIKHDIYHIMHSHMKRAHLLRRKYSALAVNLAMDISINQYIKGLPAFMDTLDGVRLSYNADLSPGKTLEEYAKAIQEAIERLKVNKDNNEDRDEGAIEWEMDYSHAHDVWDMSEDSFNFEQIDDITRKTANSANRGKIPEGLEPILKKINEKPEISWSQYLKKIMGTTPLGYKKTITRKDRRQPDRLDLRGKLPHHAAKVAVAIDISGSMSDVEIEQAMKEIFSIVRDSAGEITVIECDSEIRRVYKARDKKDIKAKLNTKGGTRFSPVFKYLRDKGMRNCLLIYFTDGLGEEELDIIPSNYKTLWVLTGKGEKLSLNRPYGEVKRLSLVKCEDRFDYAAKGELIDMLVEWAK